jgi:hypothetical protein
MRSLFSAVLLTLLLVVPVSGGLRSSYHEKPYVMYDDKDHPLADTAVFAVIRHGGYGSRIQKVDGKKPHCGIVGCPLWVRVLPGSHVFEVNLDILNTFPRKHGTAELTVSDMKPSHLYDAQFHIEDKKFRVTAEDLGENPDYGVKLGLNAKYYRVEF